MVEQFLRPDSPAQAVQLRGRADGVYLAGGTELNYRGAPAAGTLICLDALPLSFIRVAEDMVRLGPTVTFQQVADSKELTAAGMSVLRRAARSIGNRSIRNRATVGGNVAANKSCADLILPLLVLGATLRLLTEQGEHELALESYLSSPDRTALITAIDIPRPSEAVRFGHERFSRTANDLALINVALAVRVEGTTLKEPRLAIGGVAPTVVRQPAAEAILEGANRAARVGELLDQMGEAVRAHVHPIDDQRGSATFKADLAAELARRALATCIADEED